MRQCGRMAFTWAKVRIENWSVCTFCCAKGRRKDAAFEGDSKETGEEDLPLKKSKIACEK